ncbi:NCS1 family nucleobase:cation symporter-1, partial [Acinetobacter baumannii]|nr:NCS1 family nucleobase:cation symporter-1 [Acinetobacter baumannii]
LDTQGSYWYKNGYNHSAFYALIPASLIPILCVLLPQLSWLALIPIFL